MIQIGQLIMSCQYTDVISVSHGGSLANILLLLLQQKANLQNLEQVLPELCHIQSANSIDRG